MPRGWHGCGSLQIPVNYRNTVSILAKAKADARYKIAFPGQLLEEVAVHTLEGIKAIHIKVYQKEERNSVRELLNEAWKKFIHDPKDYIAWEKLKREEFNVL